MKRLLDLVRGRLHRPDRHRDEIASAAAVWGASYRTDPADSNGNYEREHIDKVYLADAQGMPPDRLFYGAGSAVIAGLLKQVSG